MANFGINRKSFFSEYRNHFDRLHQGQVDALENLLELIEANPPSLNHTAFIRRTTYLLATIYHETALTFLPLHEYGGADYFNTRYSPERAVGQQLGNTKQGDGARYAGRGFVQLTGRNNYVKASERLSIDLVNNPHLAMQPEIAYKIAIIGMRSGWFTGKKFDDYLDGKTPDYLNARRIINGTDCARQIADYAAKFEQILKRSIFDTAAKTETIQFNQIEDLAKNAELVRAESSANSSLVTAHLETNAAAAAATDVFVTGENAHDSSDNGNSSPPTISQEIKINSNDAVKVARDQLPGTRPFDVPVQISQNKLSGRIYGAIGGITAIYTAASGFFKDNTALIMTGIIGIVLLALALIFKGLIIDYVRLKIFADSGKYNAK